MKQWIKALGKERILNVETPKACIDVMLGTIAITSGARSLQEYIRDMEERGQSAERVKEVTQALVIYANYLTPEKIVRGKMHNKEGEDIEEEQKIGGGEFDARKHEIQQLMS